MDGERVRVREMWSVGRRPPPQVRRKRRGTVRGVRGRGEPWVDGSLLDGLVSAEDGSGWRMWGLDGRSLRG